MILSGVNLIEKEASLSSAFWNLDINHGLIAISEMETGRIEILRPAGQAGWNTGQILLSCN